MSDGKTFSEATAEFEEFLEDNGLDMVKGKTENYQYVFERIEDSDTVDDDDDDVDDCPDEEPEDKKESKEGE